MRKNRKEIDNFLINLDKFIGDNIDIMDIRNLLFFIKGNRNNITCIQKGSEDIDIRYLVYVINKDGGSARTDKYIRRICYKVNYIEVQDVSYEHIFMKYLIQQRVCIAEYVTYNIFEKQLKGYDLKTFLIPEDWYHNQDLIIYKK